MQQPPKGVAPSVWSAMAMAELGWAAQHLAKVAQTPAMLKSLSVVQQAHLMGAITALMDTIAKPENVGKR